ncbi:MAG: ABC transporter permease [Bacteroidales bacterium]|nr:ABC transporter permease [Bacteroidales bacterium]
MINKLSSFFVFFYESLNAAISSLKTNKLRSFLSLVGITIGIFCLDSIFSILDSIESQISKSIELLETNTLYVQKWPWTFESDYPWLKYVNRTQVTFKEADQLRAMSKFPEAVVFVSGSIVKVKSSTQIIENAFLLAVSQHFEKVSFFEIEKVGISIKLNSLETIM